MPGRECWHCKQWVEEGAPHDCWTTSEAALTRDLSEDLRDAWERLRETAVEFGDQRIYASHNSIMFAKKACYFFVRPKTSRLEVCFFLGRTVKAPQVRRAMPASRVKTAHIVYVVHRDEVETPLTEWLREAFDVSDSLSGARGVKSNAASTSPRRRDASSAKRTNTATAAAKKARSPQKPRVAPKPRRKR